MAHFDHVSVYQTVDWRITHGDKHPDDLPEPRLREPWRVTFEAVNNGPAYITAVAPDGTKRSLMLEIDRGMLAVRVYLDPNANCEQPTTVLLSDDAMYVVPPSAPEADRAKLVAKANWAPLCGAPSDIPTAVLAGPAEAI